MHSLRTKITLLTVCVIVIAVCVVTLLSVLFIRNNDKRVYICTKIFNSFFGKLHSYRTFKCKRCCYNADCKCTKL